MARPNGPEGKISIAPLSSEERASMRSENRDNVSRSISNNMSRMPLNRDFSAKLDEFNNVFCQKIGVPAIQDDELRSDFAKMIIDDTLNDRGFEASYKKYFSQKLSMLLAASVSKRNENLLNAPEGDENVPGSNEVVDAYESLMQSFMQNMRSYGIRKQSDVLPQYGGNNSKELYDLQIGAHKALIPNACKKAYEKCSNRGTATVSETLQAARSAVANAFIYGKAFPAPASEVGDMGDPEVLSSAVNEAANVIKGLQQVHSSRSLGWILFHPINYFREGSTIRTLKGMMQRNGGLSQEAVEQKLSEPIETYGEVSRDFNEISDRYTERRNNEAEKALEGERQNNNNEEDIFIQDKQDVINSEEAYQYSLNEMRKAGLSKAQVHERANQEYLEDMRLLEGINDRAVVGEIIPVKDEEKKDELQNNDRIQINVDDSQKVEEVSQRIEPARENSQPIIEPKK